VRDGPSTTRTFTGSRVLTLEGDDAVKSPALLPFAIL
jgi:hypothetical protein